MKEYLLITVVGLFLAASVLNYFAGPVVISVKDPLQFLTPLFLHKYPFTAMEIGLRTIALFLSIILALSLMEKKYFLKAASSLFLGALGIFYAIQQIATFGRVTPIQWTLAFAYAGFTLLPAIVYYLIRGLVEGAYNGLTKGKTKGPEPFGSKPQGRRPAEGKETSKFWGS